MDHTSPISKSFSLAFSLSYSVLALILIAPIYYQYSRIDPGYYNFYSVMSADLPVITQLMLRAHEISYIFFLAVVIAAAWFYMRTRRGKSNVVALVFLNITLFACVGWRELASFALQLPALEILNVR